MSHSRLLNLLIQLDDLLAKHHVRYDITVHPIRQQAELEPGPTTSTELRAKALAMFGAMGSLTDIIITRSNGHLVDDEDHANQQLDVLRTEIYAELTDT
jgi:hypothetical protein